MEKYHWIKKQANFERISKALVDDLVIIKNTGDIVDEFYSYSKKFHFAADLITNHLLTVARENNDIAKLDTWFFAITYLYRQSLELILKALVLSKIEIAEQKIMVIGEVRHDLRKCFDNVLGSLSNDIILSGYDNFHWLEKYLDDISSMDRQSDMFRYPFNHRMEAFFTEQTHINLLAIKQNINSAYRMLNDLYEGRILFKGEYERDSPKLIIHGGNYYEQSVIGYKFSQNDFYPFIKGYEESANLLQKYMERDGNSDLLFLPMCYLYRNAVELSLKRILTEDCKINYRDAMNIMKSKGHSVLGLWNKIKDEIAEYANAPEGDTTVIDAERYILQLHHVDPDSTKFRYPVGLKLNFHYQKEVTYSITNASDFFNELLSFLDAVDTMLSVIREWEAEMEAESRSNYSDYDY